MVSTFKKCTWNKLPSPEAIKAFDNQVCENALRVHQEKQSKSNDDKSA